jgi:hypothetical protein
LGTSAAPCRADHVTGQPRVAGRHPGQWRRGSWGIHQRRRLRWRHGPALAHPHPVGAQDGDAALMRRPRRAGQWRWQRCPRLE